MSFIPNPKVPCAIHIDGGVYPGRIILIQGTVFEGANSLTIDLQASPSFDVADDIAFRLSFMFSGERCVKWNSFHVDSREWGVEEENDINPLREEEPFEIVITCEYNSFEVQVNGDRFCSFAYRRMPLDEIRYILVSGEVTLTGITFATDEEYLAVSSSPYGELLPESQTRAEVAAPPPPPPMPPSPQSQPNPLVTPAQGLPPPSLPRQAQPPRLLPEETAPPSIPPQERSPPPTFIQATPSSLPLCGTPTPPSPTSTQTTPPISSRAETPPPNSLPPQGSTLPSPSKALPPLPTVTPPASSHPSRVSTPPPLPSINFITPPPRLPPEDIPQRPQSSCLHPLQRRCTGGCGRKRFRVPLQDNTAIHVKRQQFSDFELTRVSKFQSDKSTQVSQPPTPPPTPFQQFQPSQSCQTCQPCQCRYWSSKTSPTSLPPAVAPPVPPPHLPPQETVPPYRQNTIQSNDNRKLLPSTVAWSRRDSSTISLGTLKDKTPRGGRGMSQLRMSVQDRKFFADEDDDEVDVDDEPYTGPINPELERCKCCVVN